MNVILLILFLNFLSFQNEEVLIVLPSREVYQQERETLIRSKSIDLNSQLNWQESDINRFIEIGADTYPDFKIASLKGHLNKLKIPYSEINEAFLSDNPDLLRDKYVIKFRYQLNILRWGAEGLPGFELYQSGKKMMTEGSSRKLSRELKSLTKKK